MLGEAAGGDSTHKPRRCSMRVALLLQLLTALPLVNSLQCRTYVPQKCLFDTNGSAPVVFPQPLHPASFRLEEETSCPFYDSGVFQQSECNDDFMAEEARKLPTADDTAYCTSGSLPGEFKRQGERFIFTPHPESSCNYFEYRRSEVLQYLQAEQMDILVAGDSMMRQLYVRLVHMMRGARRVLDYHIHTPGSYSVCAEADRFRMSPVNANRSVESFKKLDLDYLEESIQHLFRYQSMDEAMMPCAEPHVNMNYMHAPDYELQMRFLKRYMAEVASSERSLTLVLSVGYWVWTPDVPQEYLDFLESLVTKVHRIVIVSIATVHTMAHAGKQGPALLEAYQARNRFMKEWTASRSSSNIVFVDFDNLSLSRHAPPICVGENWHYQCFLTWPTPRNIPVLSDMDTNWFRDRLYRAPLLGVYMTEDGQCFDEMNRSLWVVALNLITK